jgi:lipid-A-disaccharide synthase
VPTVVAYKGSVIEYLIYRAMVRVPSVVLANIVLGETVMPQYLQHEATPERLAAALGPLLSESPERRAQVAALARTAGLMAVGGGSPSAKAAEIVLDVAAKASHLRREMG